MGRHPDPGQQRRKARAGPSGAQRRRRAINRSRLATTTLHFATLAAASAAASCGRLMHAKSGLSAGSAVINFDETYLAPRESMHRLGSLGGFPGRQLQRKFDCWLGGAAVTRQIVFDRSSATIRAPCLVSTVTPTGRPRVLPSSPMKPVSTSTGCPDGRPFLKGTKTTL